MCMKDVLTEVDDLLLVFDSVWSAWSCQFQALLCNSHSEAEVNGHCTLCMHLELVTGLVPLGYKNPFQNLPYSSHSTTFFYQSTISLPCLLIITIDTETGTLAVQHV